MPSLLRKLTINSVDSVDAGSGVGCRVLIRKRKDDAMQTDEILKAAQAGNVSEPVMFAAMTVLAGQYFPLAKSDAEAWVQFTEHNAIGKRMEAVRRALPKGTLEERLDFVKAMSPAPHREQPIDADGENESEIDAMASEHRKAHPELSHAQAVAHVLSTPEGTAAYRRAKAARNVA